MKRGAPHSRPDAEFAAYACELLAASLGPCRARRMFGGFGVDHEGLMVAIVADLGDGLRLWLKADDEARVRFESAGCSRFTYTAKGVKRSAGYYAVPDEAMESGEAMAPWARLAMAAAVSARARKKPAGPRTARKPPGSSVPSNAAASPAPRRRRGVT